MKKYRSGYDIAVLALAFVAAIGIFSVTIGGASSQAEISALVFTLVITGVVMIATMFPCQYTLEESHLQIRCGLIKKKIEYADIESVEPSWNPLAAPAASFKRVRISLKHSFALVSPKQQSEFIQELRKRAGIAI